MTLEQLLLATTKDGVARDYFTGLLGYTFTIRDEVRRVAIEATFLWARSGRTIYYDNDLTADSFSDRLQTALREMADEIKAAFK